MVVSHEFTVFNELLRLGKLIKQPSLFIIPCFSYFFHFLHGHTGRYFFDQFATMAMNDPNQNFALRNQLRFCLDTLSADDQRILLLHTEYGMNLHEVADQLAITHVAARKRFERALARLCNAWNEQENGKGGQSHG